MSRAKGLKFAVLLVVFATIAVSAEKSQDWNYYYKEALNKRIKGDYIGALADLEVAVKLAPDKPEIYTARGIAYEKTGNFAAAMADYEFALTLNSNSPEAVHNIRALKAFLEKSGDSITLNVTSSDLAPSVYEESKSREDYGDYENYAGNENYERYGVTPSFQGNPYGNEGYGEYERYGTIPSFRGNPYGNEGYGEYERYGATLPVQGNPYGNGGYVGHNVLPPIQSNHYSNGGYEGYSMLSPVQGDPYSRRGVVSFFPERGAEEDSVPASQPVKGASQIRPVAMPISEQNTQKNGNTPFVRAAVNGVPDKTIIIQQGDAMPGALNSPFCSPSAADPIVVKIIVNGSASVKLQDGRVFQQEPLTATVNMAERGSETPVYDMPVQPVQKIFVDPVAETYNNYGAALYRQGLYNEAVLHFTEAIKAYPNYAIAYNNRGLALIEKGDFESAVLDFEQALRINPYYHDAQFNRSTIINSIARR